MFLSNDKDGNGRDDDHDNTCDHQGDGLGIYAVQHADADLNGSHIVGACYKQRPHVHIPCVDKGIHCHSANSGFCQRKQDPYDKFQIAAAVKLCRLIQLDRKCHVKLSE